jgi:hypothetical protein
VGEEGQAAQNDQGAQQTGGDGEDQDLEQAALNEGELKRVEHRCGGTITGLRPVLIYRGS